MHHRTALAAFLSVLSCAFSSLAFTPPTDARQNISLSIADFPEHIEKERLVLRKVPTDQPLAFTVTLKNESARPVSGTVVVWLNDDWTVSGTNALPLSAAPGASATLTCTAIAKPSVLGALYPIHATFTFASTNGPVVLHPIAIFETEKPADAPNAQSARECALADGVTRLDVGVDRRVFCRQKDKTVELGVNFSGSDAASGTHMARESTARDGVARAGFSIHPPYRGAPGVTWNDFSIALPPGKPAKLTFHTSLRDHSATEPPSDGTEFKVFVVDLTRAEKELFSRFSDAKGWEPASVDLSAYAGQRITLRLWTGPGPKNNTTCDQCYWGDPAVTVGRLPALPSETQWLAREQEASAHAARAVAERPKRGTGAFRLDVNGRRFGAAVVLGEQGLTDAVFAFSDGDRALTYRGFACDVFPDRLAYEPETRRFALETQHDAAFFFIPSAKGAFDAARAYSDLNGFKKGRGVDALRGRICLDQWGGDYREAAKGLEDAARYGVTDAVFVKHVWQRWGYDYRLPEIYPPAGGLEPFLAMCAAADKAGVLFCPHDNYIDFYPDAEGYSYDQIVFNENGQPVRAWYNKGRRAQSYRWLPHGFRPWLEPNMAKMRDGFRPDALFIDVFSAISPFDYYDRAGNFYPRMRTTQEWRDAFDTCRSILKKGAPMISEAGTDALIGSLDAGEADHFPATRWMKDFGDSDRTPWHDMATHGKMVLFAGGLGPRYSALDWEKVNRPEHGYGSDDYLSNTVLGGRNPMCDGPFSRRAVMTYWLLHDVCDALARERFESHAFGPTIHQQHTVFGDGCRVWSNRDTNTPWNVAGRVLPTYGFCVETPDAQAGIVLIDGQRAGYAQSAKTFFADARPTFNPLRRVAIESSVASGSYLGNGAFAITYAWDVLDPSVAGAGYAPFVHISSDALKGQGGENIAFQAEMPFDRALLAKAGAFEARGRIAIPADMPAGDYKIRYGLYRPGSGDRLTIRGLSDGGSRIRGGTLRVAKSGGAFTSGTFIPETMDAETDADLNVAKKMLDFGPVVTDGAFRLLHANRKAWDVVPLPGSNPFRAEIRLTALNAKRARVARVENVGPFNAAAALPQWKQDGAVLTLACDGQSFAYRIMFE